MMFLSKQGLFSVFLCGVCSAYAGTNEPSKNVVHSEWEFGGSALYLRPSMGGYVLPGQLQSSGDVGQIRNYANWSPDWSWGFKLDAAYHFDTKNDLNLNGYHLADTTHYVFSQQLDSNSQGTATKTFRSGSSDVSYNWNVLNLEFGRTIDFSPLKRVRLHLGAQYNRIATETQSAGVATILAVTNPYSRTLTGNFYGYGPRAGVDAAYGWANGFGLYGNAALSILIGNKQFSDTGNVTTTPTLYNASYFAITPGIEAKMGASFTHSLAQGALTVDTGWMWVDYVNALPYRLVLSSVQSAPREADFAVQGPYVGLKWLGNIG